jgi:hypothetical protein
MGGQPTLPELHIKYSGGVAPNAAATNPPSLHKEL